MAPRYKAPASLELTARAEVIVLATITGERGATDAWKSVVIATPTVLLKGGALVPFRSSFSRDAEDVASPDALWAKAVREYVAFRTGSKRKARRG